MISVAEARAHLLSMVQRLDAEEVPLREAASRLLAGPVEARQTQPPFAASAMDGYAVSGPPPAPGTAFEIVGEAAAGHPYEGSVAPGQAVRIFTGAPLPKGADRVVIQEDMTREGDRATVTQDPGPSTHIRPAGGDFAAGTEFASDSPLGARGIALLAAMGHARLPVIRRPVIAILMTGDELRPPGAALDPGEITASNGYGLAAMVEAHGAEARLLPIARDTEESLAQAIDLAQGVDLLLTVGGASVGDHDLVAGALAKAGMDPVFHRVAMRPGKPLMAGRLGEMAVVGLPGNPVSAMVCARIFILPMLHRMLGLPQEGPPVERPLANDVPANGPRQHYMRAERLPDGSVRVADRQDSSLLSVLARADTLVIRPPHAPAAVTGALVPTVNLSDETRQS
ncbi:molybdopterin molybdotransferase MoeA [Jannaschia seohaensis]|uniref:Molybdopterin molybdenumtransferase n=1 Tax=Jannaschia seohaensis TaxID=475081 RepID=A0A2Y9AK96_9RHOB|nr:molybdopterin molybdotransferase MoeA [Jannaschia seohaensis]PWJ20397.1 molybdopterin molybdotransferase [Jannaschia seohaensis]SSA44466.1 molybdopterin molybdotransferase [Jannaschia seohaensis]